MAEEEVLGGAPRQRRHQVELLVDAATRRSRAFESAGDVRIVAVDADGLPASGDAPGQD